MALLHDAELSPTKSELLSAWLPTRRWGPAGGAALDHVGDFRFDDPRGEVGVEVHLVRAGGELFQVPLTYRGAPLVGADDHLVSTMSHTVLGDRWVYDGVYDPVCQCLLAAAALTGSGQAVSLFEYDGRWMLEPTAVRVHGGGWTGGEVAVDGFEVIADDADGASLVSDHFELIMARRPAPGALPPIGLTATWPGAPEPVVLATISER